MGHIYYHDLFDGSYRCEALSCTFTTLLVSKPTILKSKAALPKEDRKKGCDDRLWACPPAPCWHTFWLWGGQRRPPFPTSTSHETTGSLQCLGSTPARALLSQKLPLTLGLLFNPLKALNRMSPHRMPSDFAFFYKIPKQALKHTHTHTLTEFLFLNSKGKLKFLLISMP